MYNYNEEFFEEMAKAYPELMEKASINSFGVGKGWHKLIEVLCGSICDDLSQAKWRLKAATDYPRDDGGKYLAETEAQVALALSNLPVISQVKEKFGTMRFYVRGGNDKVDALVRFAESMSHHTCEQCGDRGYLDHGGAWVKTHCEFHQRGDET